MNRLFLMTTVALYLTPVSASATNLIEAWAAAVRHDPDHRSAEAAREAGDEADVQARALKRPSIQVQGGYQYAVTEANAQLPDDLDPFFTGRRNNSRASVGVQAVQPIYDASKRAQSIQLHEKAAASRVQFEGEEQQLMLRVTQAYFSVLSAQDELTACRRQVVAAEEQRRGAQARFDAGRARITDVREAVAKRDAGEVKRIAAESDLAYARAAFTELTGLPADGLDRPAADFTPSLPLPSLEDALEQAEADAPAVRAAEHGARAAGADVDRYGLSGRPVVEGVAGYQGQYRLTGESGNGIIPDHIQSASVGLRLTVPLYAGGAITSKKREAQANTAKAMRDLDAARRDARLQARKAWYAVSNGARRIAALGTARGSAGLQQAATTLGREVGIRTQNDVLNAQSQNIDTERDRLQAVYDYMLARLQLDAATGRLDENELQNVSRLMRGGAPG